jgi:hypothetical protein
MLFHVTVFALAESVGLIPATSLLGPACRLSSRRLAPTLYFGSFHIGTKPFGHPSFTAFDFLARNISPQFGAFIPPALPSLFDFSGNSSGLLPEFVGFIATPFPLGTRGNFLEFDKMSPHPFQRLCRLRPTKSSLKRSLDFFGLGPHTPGLLLDLACFRPEPFNPFSCLGKLPEQCLLFRTDETISIPVELMLQVRLDGHSFLTGRDNSKCTHTYDR